jgi:hypothetical protein
MTRLAPALILALLAFSAAPAAAQVPQTPAPGDTLLPVADTVPREAPSPRAAFVRALLVPGLGHFTIGEYRRGTVYFTMQTASWAMLTKTLLSLQDARSGERRMSGLARDSVEGAMAQDTALARQLRDDPEAFDRALLTYRDLASHRGLVSAREQQRQDWIVYTLVTTFAAAIDAYVTAHLSEFPADITTSRSRDGATRIGVSVPVGRRR